MLHHRLDSPYKVYWFITPSMRDMPYNLPCITTFDNGVENAQILDIKKRYKKHRN